MAAFEAYTLHYTDKRRTVSGGLDSGQSPPDGSVPPATLDKFNELLKCIVRIAYKNSGGLVLTAAFCFG
jgi:hypothetical protein